MTQLRLGPIVAAASGSSGGTTFSHNRWGPYIRSRTKPVDPKSPRQLAQRARMGFLAEQWHETPMDDAKRLAWDVYASGVSAKNKLGDDITLIGYNLFVAGNSVKLLNGSDFVEDGPIVIGYPAQDPLFAVALSEASGITVTFDDTFEWADEDDAYMSIEIGKPQSPSRTYFGGPYRFHAGISGDSVTAPTSPEGPTAVTAWTLLKDQKVWVRARILRADGRLSGAFGAAPVIVAA